MSSPLTLSSSPTSLSSLFSSLSPSPSSKPYFHHSPISCGPRDNRPQLLRGRILSSEAILAIQALKRSSSSSADLRPLFSRLIKPDLLAALRELLRQNHCLLALTVFSSARREPWYRTDYSLYAEIISALARNGMPSEIDRLVADIVEEGFYAGDSRGLGRLLRTLVAAERPKAVIDVYELMKRGECVLDEFMYKKYLAKWTRIRLVTTACTCKAKRNGALPFKLHVNVSSKK
ncbi:pentatricopeptide repeat-containing protein [Cinnamomum micranthum f. kanehirae]|uniref:Pentatricopeptide repeat-containing protein n=1 Tax=Cinnamomum micranthum f. kanehirae TaxID=337451 RepID=A0A3S4PW52_9MAGN|nr:pentatricopeptide repeat-containing protein [Cinnamomum micranthum f. kanehirae]